MSPAELDAREEHLGQLIVKLRRYPYPSTLEAADVLAALWLELRDLLGHGVQMTLPMEYTT